MRCARCGNDNPDDNRFCGMCGATLLAPTVTAVAETQTQRAASSTAAIPLQVAPVVTAPPPPPPAPPPPIRVERPRPQEPEEEEMDEPAISGPSFLGLNDPAPRKRARLSIDPHDSRRSRGGHYLLEDEEEPRRGGRKIPADSRSAGTGSRLRISALEESWLRLAFTVSEQASGGDTGSGRG